MKFVAFPMNYVAKFWAVGPKVSPETCLARTGLAKTRTYLSENSAGKTVTVSAPETQIFFRAWRRKYSASSQSKAKAIYTSSTLLIKVMGLKQVRWKK